TQAPPTYHVIADHRRRLGAVLEINVRHPYVGRHRGTGVVVERERHSARVLKYRAPGGTAHTRPISANGSLAYTGRDAVAAREGITAAKQHLPPAAKGPRQRSPQVGLLHHPGARRTAARARHRRPGSRHTGRRRASEPIGPTWRIRGHTQIAVRRVRPIVGRHRHGVGSVATVGQVQVRRHRPSGYVLAVMPGIRSIAPAATATRSPSVPEVPTVGDMLESTAANRTVARAG